LRNVWWLESLALIKARKPWLGGVDSENIQYFSKERKSMLFSQTLDTAKDLLIIGVDQSRLGDHRRAIESFSQVLRFDPEDADAYGHRCVARHRMGDRLGAIADCESAAALYLEQGNIKNYHYALKMLEKLQ
jgi:Flp pilus assembly protein TadD